MINITLTLLLSIIDFGKWIVLYVWHVKRRNIWCFLFHLYFMFCVIYCLNLIDAFKFDLVVHKQFSILLIVVPIFWFVVHLFHYLHVYFLIILSNVPPCFCVIVLFKIWLIKSSFLYASHFPVVFKDWTLLVTYCSHYHAYIWETVKQLQNKHETLITVQNY